MTMSTIQINGRWTVFRCSNEDLDCSDYLPSPWPFILIISMYRAWPYTIHFHVIISASAVFYIYIYMRLPLVIIFDVSRKRCRIDWIIKCRIIVNLNEKESVQQLYKATIVRYAPSSAVTFHSSSRCCVMHSVHTILSLTQFYYIHTPGFWQEKRMVEME